MEKNTEKKRSEIGNDISELLPKEIIEEIIPSKVNADTTQTKVVENINLDDQNLGENVNTNKECVNNYISSKSLKSDCSFNNLIKSPISQDNSPTFINSSMYQRDYIPITPNKRGFHLHNKFLGSNYKEISPKFQNPSMNLNSSINYTNIRNTNRRYNYPTQSYIPQYMTSNINLNPSNQIQNIPHQNNYISRNIVPNINLNQSYLFPNIISKSNINEVNSETLQQFKTFKILYKPSTHKIFLRLIKTCKGSIHFQKLLETYIPNLKETNLIVNIILKNILEMMCDYYGNYFLQKFFPFCSKYERLMILKKIKPNFLFLSNNISGNHCLQRLILLIDSVDEENIILEFIENVNLASLCYNANSCHVLEKIIKIIPEDKREKINTFVINNIYNLSMDPNGIYIIREFIRKTENVINKCSIALMLEIQTQKLIDDQYGNFVIQEAIIKLGEKYCSKILKKIRSNLLYISLEKFSSNVVDCVVKFYYNTDLKVFYEIINKIFMNQYILSEMLKNKYATFVIENCLNIVFVISKVEHHEKEFVELRHKINKYLLSIPLIKEKKKVWKILSEVNFKV